MRARVLPAILMAGFALSGCSTLAERFFAVSNHGNEQATLSTDATRRIISDRNRPGEDSLRNGAGRVVCIEPSPDVAAAVSSSVRLAMDLGGERKSSDGSTADYKAGGEYSRSIATSIMQLGERLATIQLLRDKMYRACEAFANGAIGGASYTLMLARLDKTMTTLLATQMAAGAFGQVAAMTGASAQSGGTYRDTKVLEKHAAFKKAAGAFNEVMADEKKSKEKETVEAARKAVTDALSELALAEAATLSGTIAQANAEVTGRGAAASKRQATDALNVRLIHRNYLDDDGVEPLMDACIVAMDAPLDRNAVKDAFARKLKTSMTPDRQLRIKSLADEIQKQQGDRTTEEAARSRAERKFERDDLVSAYAEAGYIFQSFCLQNILDGHSDFLEDRMKAKLQLRKIDAYSTTAHPKLAMCSDIAMSGMKTENKKLILASLKCENISDTAPVQAPAATPPAPPAKGPAKPAAITKKPAAGATPRKADASDSAGAKKS
jgi:hypothetical protein